MRIIALWVGKLTFVGMQLLGRRGAALPGLVVERLSSSFLAKSLNKLPDGVVIISGTNGKTTSTKMLSHVLGSKYKVLTNPTGSNFVRGIVASIIQNSKWSGGLPYDIGVFELDEAYAARFVKLYKPRGLVVLNIMRDQMDRFGEIDQTAKLLADVVKNTTDFVVLNGDDERVFDMHKASKARVYYFGVDASLRDIFRTDDELHSGALVKAKEVSYSATLSDLKPDNTATIELGKDVVKAKLSASGTYNAQNATAVVLTASVLKIDVEQITTLIAEVKPAFGRGEHIKVGDKTVILQLVKNPGGFRHALITGYQLKASVTMIAINDDYADGRDVSWLWDVDFVNNLSKGYLLTSGVRAADMALRLKYDDIKADTIEANLHGALKSAIDKCPTRGTVLIYSTYTAMLELRQLLGTMAKVEKI